MPTQKEIAEHLFIDQSNVSRFLERAGIDWTAATMDQIRGAYIRQLRAQASGHTSSDGDSLVKERVLTERVDRELKQLQLAEKRGTLVNVVQLEAEFSNMAEAFSTELLARDNDLKNSLDALHGIDIDLAIINNHTYSALGQLGRFKPEQQAILAAVALECDPSTERGGVP